MSSLSMKMVGPVRMGAEGDVDRGVGKEVRYKQEESLIGLSSCCMVMVEQTIE